MALPTSCSARHDGPVTYDIDAWHDFFVASAGAAAALAGLVFVAVSINIERILEIPGMADRGLQAVLLLVTAVVVSLFALVPQETRSLGIQILVVSSALIVWFFKPKRHQNIAADPNVARRIARLATNAAGSLPYFIGAVMLVSGTDHGLRLILAGVIASIIGGVINAWVLLVEILR